ncbi:hypothetical protein F9B74_02700 [Pelistega sp. NLN82]|uniref:Uncharacterized protein n=1 Tax=Pelistega ratti TaxID=2652177 RepID=A0A6L9Y604_9BURK|nr:hypothetical protein [Pelistega ratti]NEN75238.1 hypothetical protein [Pelistega ratti]
MQNHLSPAFSANGWRRLSNGRLQHISGIEFEKNFNEPVHCVKESLPVFFQNLKQEGVDVVMAEKLFLKLSQQAQEHFIGLH